RLLAHGPTHEYRVQPTRSWRLSGPGAEEHLWDWHEPRSEEKHFYTHAEVALRLKAGEEPREVLLRVTRGETVAGRLLGPDGQPVQNAVLLCGEKVTPLRNGAVLPLPLRGGRYELPGCLPGKVYPVLFLDAANQRGAAVDLTAGSGVGPDVRLLPCGSARVRLVDGYGRPQA